MKKELKFFFEVNKLKKIPRTGWVWLEVENPETIAEHIFRVALSSWLLTKKRKLSQKRIIKIALFHDLCEVFAGDITPYFDLLPKDKKKRKEILKRWIRLSQKEKEKRAKKKFEIEKKSLLKLIKFLDLETRKEIFSLWLDYEKGITLEGKLVKQIDKIETMLQAIEYFGTKKDTPVIGWWEEVEELVEDPEILDFLKAIEKKIYRKKIEKTEKIERLEKILDFLLKINQLKKMPRKGWILRGVKNPETIAAHTFMLALMSWFFYKKFNLKLDEEKVLKMALSHELCEIYAGDTTPYDPILKEGKKVFKKWIRFPQDEKRKFFLLDYKKEKKALEKLLKNLPSDLKKEIFVLWKEFKENKTREAKFLNQVYVIETLFEALWYWRKNKKFPIEPWWEWAFENVDQSFSLGFLKELEKEFKE